MHVVRKLVKLEINANFTLLDAKRMHIAVTSTGVLQRK